MTISGSQITRNYAGWGGENLILQSSAGGGNGGNGGGIALWGNVCVMTLTDSVVSDNRAGNGGGINGLGLSRSNGRGGDGGGIVGSGDVTIMNSMILRNRAGVFGEPGGDVGLSGHAWKNVNVCGLIQDQRDRKRART